MNTPTPKNWMTDLPKRDRTWDELYAFAALPTPTPQEALQLITSPPIPEAKRKLHQMGLWAYVRYCRNMGIDFIDCYVSVFGKMPRKV
jgi:hypothetical protein